MITINTIADLYQVEINLEVETLNKDIKVLQPLYHKSLTYFKTVPSSIKSHVDIEKIKNNTQTLISNLGVKDRNGKITALPLTSVETYFNLKLKNFKEINREYRTKLKRRDELLKNKIPKNIFIFIITRFNELLVEELIHNKYPFFTNLTGKLKVVLNKANKPTINWDKSIKNKKRLLSENLIPFIKADKEAADSRGEVYKGVQWLEYNFPYSFYYEWTTLHINKFFIPNAKDFVFIPYRGSNSPVIKLHKYKQQFTEEELINLYPQYHGNESSIN